MAPDLLAHRQIVVAGRNVHDVDKRIALAEVQWRTDSPTAALLLVEAGLGWAWLPGGLVAPSVAAGRLVHIPSANFTNILNFFIDVAWGGDQALGLAARRLVELLSMQAMAIQAMATR